MVTVRRISHWPGIMRAALAAAGLITAAAGLITACGSARAAHPAPAAITPGPLGRYVNAIEAVRLPVTAVSAGVRLRS